MVAYRGNDSLSDDRGNRVFNARLDDTWTEGMSDGEDVSEVKIVSEYNHAGLPRIVHDHGIVSSRISNDRPVHGLDRPSGKIINPIRGEVHVEEDLHFDESGTSNSSERQAA